MEVGGVSHCVRLEAGGQKLPPSSLSEAPLKLAC